MGEVRVEYLRFAVHLENIGVGAHFGPARRGPGTDSGEMTRLIEQGISRACLDFLRKEFGHPTCVSMEICTIYQTDREKTRLSFHIHEDKGRVYGRTAM